jgi:hypothetical protein
VSFVENFVGILVDIPIGKARDKGCEEASYRLAIE